MRPEGWVAGAGLAIVAGIAYAMSRGPRIFISFEMEDVGARNLLSHQAKNSRFSVKFVDASLHEPFDEKWKTNCRKRIASTKGTIVLIGSNTHRAEAVEWEVAETIRQGHPCLGVQVHRGKSHRLPSSLANSKVVPWNLADIKRRIENW